MKPSIRIGLAFAVHVFIHVHVRPSEAFSLMRNHPPQRHVYRDTLKMTSHRATYDDKKKKGGSIGNTDNNNEEEDVHAFTSSSSSSSRFINPLSNKRSLIRRVCSLALASTVGWTAARSALASTMVEGDNVLHGDVQIVLPNMDDNAPATAEAVVRTSPRKKGHVKKRVKVHPKLQDRGKEDMDKADSSTNYYPVATTTLVGGYLWVKRDYRKRVVSSELRNETSLSSFESMKAEFEKVLQESFLQEKDDDVLEESPQITNEEAKIPEGEDDDEAVSYPKPFIPFSVTNEKVERNEQTDQWIQRVMMETEKLESGRFAYTPTGQFASRFLNVGFDEENHFYPEFQTAKEQGGDDLISEDISLDNDIKNITDGGTNSTFDLTMDTSCDDDVTQRLFCNDEDITPFVGMEEENLESLTSSAKELDEIMQLSSVASDDDDGFSMESNMDDIQILLDEVLENKNPSKDIVGNDKENKSMIVEQNEICSEYVIDDKEDSDGITTSRSEANREEAGSAVDIEVRGLNPIEFHPRPINTNDLTIPISENNIDQAHSDESFSTFELETIEFVDQEPIENEKGMNTEEVTKIIENLDDDPMIESKEDLPVINQTSKFVYTAKEEGSCTESFKVSPDSFSDVDFTGDSPKEKLKLMENEYEDVPECASETKMILNSTSVQGFGNHSKIEHCVQHPIREGDSANRESPNIATEGSYRFSDHTNDSIAETFTCETSSNEDDGTYNLTDVVDVSNANDTAVLNIDEKEKGIISGTLGREQPRVEVAESSMKGHNSTIALDSVMKHLESPTRRIEMQAIQGASVKSVPDCENDEKSQVTGVEFAPVTAEKGLVPKDKDAIAFFLKETGLPAKQISGAILPKQEEIENEVEKEIIGHTDTVTFSQDEVPDFDRLIKTEKSVDLQSENVSPYNLTVSSPTFPISSSSALGMKRQVMRGFLRAVTGTVNLIQKMATTTKSTNKNVSSFKKAENDYSRERLRKEVELYRLEKEVRELEEELIKADESFVPIDDDVLDTLKTADESLLPFINKRIENEENACVSYTSPQENTELFRPEKEVRELEERLIVADESFVTFDDDVLDTLKAADETLLPTIKEYIKNEGNACVSYTSSEQNVTDNQFGV